MRAWALPPTPSPAAGQWKVQPCRSSNQVTIRPPRRRDPHRAARAVTSWSPRPPSASRPTWRSSGVPGPARSVTSTRTMASPALIATVIVSPGAPEPECRTELPKTSLTSKTATSPHVAPDLAPAPPPPARQASRSPAPLPQPSAHPPSRPPPPGNDTGRRADTSGCTLDSAADVKARQPPERALEPRQAATHTAPWPRFPSAMRPWTPQHNALQRYKVTHRGTETTPRQHENSQLAGRFRSVWQVLGSNQRRLSRG